MDAGKMVERLQRALQTETLRLEVGDWPAVLAFAPSPPASWVIAGPNVIVRENVALRSVARSMELQCHGDAHGASEQLKVSARLLPNFYAHPADRTRVALPPRPPATAAEMTTWQIARLVWREQTEIDHLRAMYAQGRLTPREQLIEACIQHLVWVDLDPFAPERCRTAAKLPDQSRRCLCGRASELRRLATPTAGDVSQSVWLDAGAFAGLRSRALDRLAERLHPAPWCGRKGAETLPVRRGRLRAWEHAQRCRQDRDYWKSLPSDA